MQTFAVVLGKIQNESLEDFAHGLGLASPWFHNSYE